MQSITSPVQRSALLAYLILTPLLSLAIALLLPLPVAAIALLMLLVPSTLALVLTALAEGGQAAAALLKKLFQWQIGFRWYLVALVLPGMAILASAVIASLLRWMPAIEFRLPPATDLITRFVLIVIVAVLEELGWRGYALPRLLAHRTPIFSALLIGVLWGILHIGIGLADGRPWLPTFLTPLAASVALTWLFIQTRGSLAMAMLYHFVLDFTPQFLLYDLTVAQNLWSQTIANLGLALLLILLYGAELQRNPARQIAAMDAGL